MADKKQGKLAFRPDRDSITLSRADLAAAEYLILQAEALRWVEACVNAKKGEDDEPIKLSDHNIDQHLMDGYVLCALVNRMSPEALPLKSMNKPKEGGELSAFQAMENISMFLGACRTLGLVDEQLFTTVSLYEKKNLLQVILALHHLSRKAPDYGMPEKKTIAPGEIDFSRKELRRIRKFLAEQKVDIETLISSSNGRMAASSLVPMRGAEAQLIDDGFRQEMAERLAQKPVPESPGPKVAEISDVKVSDPKKTHNPEKEDTLMKDWWTFISYEVRTKMTNGPDFVLRRRYKEFEWLQEELLTRHPHSDLPHLPGKRGLGGKIGDALFGQDTVFLEQRRVGLEEFINNVIFHYSLRQDPATTIFLKDAEMKLIEDGVFFGYEKVAKAESDEVPDCKQTGEDVAEGSIIPPEKQKQGGCVNSLPYPQ